MRDIQKKYAEQAEIIDTLRQQLRDSEDIVSHYAGLSGGQTTTEEGKSPAAVDKCDPSVNNAHDLSFEIQQASRSG